MRNAGLEETQAGIKIAGRNINNRLRNGMTQKDKLTVLLVMYGRETCLFVFNIYLAASHLSCGTQDL